MNIQGLNKVTLLDFPGKVACTVFTGGCDLRCPFCHNSQLVLHPNYSPIDEEEIFTLLSRRRGTLDGLALTGGEPLLQKDIASFLSRVKEMGFLVKLDTNGNHPEELEGVLSLGLADYVAMDVKNSPAGYPCTVGIPDFDLSAVRWSLDMLLSRRYGVDYELRTTAVREFHDEESFRGIAGFIRGAEKYFIQNFVDSGAVIEGGLHGFEKAELEKFADIVKDSVGFVGIRGV